MTERVLISFALIVTLVIAYRWFQAVHRMRISAHAVRVTQGSDLQLPSLIYFWGHHCAPCVTQAQFLQQLPQQMMRHISLHKIDAEEEQELAASYGVFTLPTTMLLDRQGSVRHVNYGLADAKKLASQLESVL